MSKMYITNDSDLGSDVESKLDELLGPQTTLEALGPVLSLIEDPAVQEPLSIYETDPEMAAVTDEVTREYLLFGMAFDDKWCKDDVYIIMVHESGVAWVRHY